MPVELVPCTSPHVTGAELARDGQHDGRSWGQGGDMITSHLFASNESKWSRCEVYVTVSGRQCGMAEAAHAGALTPYRPVQP